MIKIKDNSTYQIIELKRAGINFFNDAIKVIQSHNIDIWIEYGSLLGYVRHNDLIPWDSEFDLGVFENTWNLDIEKSLINHGFLIIHEPYRVKIKQPNVSVGMFTIDIHLHKIEGDKTILLFGSLTPQIETVWRKLHWFFDMTKVSSNKLPIRYLSIMKSLSSSFSLMNPLIFNKKISIKRGCYNHETSFFVTLDDVEICDLFLNNIKKYRKILLYIVRLLPVFIHSKVIEFLESKLETSIYMKKYQTMPLSIYQELEDVVFCGVKVKAPKNKIYFLKKVYGEDWETPNINFSRTQMNNLIIL